MCKKKTYVTLRQEENMEASCYYKALEFVLPFLYAHDMSTFKLFYNFQYLHLPHQPCDKALQITKFSYILILEYCTSIDYLELENK